MLYVVRAGDTLFRICQRHRIMLSALIKANLICNPRLTVSGDLLQIPRDGDQLPRLGCNPYYILLPGDNLECIAHYTGTSVSNLLRNNSLHNIRRLYPGMELLIQGNRPETGDLYEQWLGRPVNNQLDAEQTQTYYEETFVWHSWGKKALAPLTELLKHSCPEVRYYAILSLGRLAINQGAINALENIKEDRYRENRKLAGLAIDRIILAQQGYRRTRLLIKPGKLMDDLNRLAPAAIPLVEGTGVVVLKWYVPVAAGTSEPGAISIFDYVMVVASGQKGFLMRPQGRLNLI